MISNFVYMFACIVVLVLSGGNVYDHFDEFYVAK